MTRQWWHTGYRKQTTFHFSIFQVCVSSKRNKIAERERERNSIKLGSFIFISFWINAIEMDGVRGGLRDLHGICNSNRFSRLILLNVESWEYENNTVSNLMKQMQCRSTAERFTYAAQTMCKVCSLCFATMAELLLLLLLWLMLLYVLSFKFLHSESLALDAVLCSFFSTKLVCVCVQFCWCSLLCLRTQFRCFNVFFFDLIVFARHGRCWFSVLISSSFSSFIHSFIHSVGLSDSCWLWLRCHNHFASTLSIISISNRSPHAEGLYEDGSWSKFYICQINVFVCFTWHRIRR